LLPPSNPDDGGGKFRRNIDKFLPYYRARNPRRNNSLQNTSVSFKQLVPNRSFSNMTASDDRETIAGGCTYRHNQYYGQLELAVV
jgi:hypothetical protein